MLVSLLHGCFITLNTVISYTCITIAWILLVHVLTSLLHRFTCIHALIISVSLLHGSLFLLHDLLLQEYICIPVAWVFNTVHDIHDQFLYHCIDVKLLLPRHIIHWFKICGAKCHTEYCTSCYLVILYMNLWGPPLESHVSWIACLLLSYICHVIPLHITCMYCKFA